MPIWKRNLVICWLGSFMCVAAMSLVLPFLPLYLEQLGLRTTAQVEQWSGLAFGITFLMAAIVSPIWGRMADRHGRKLMLLRASLGMGVVTSLMAFVSHPWQLVLLRFLMGAVSGYVSASVTLVATQTPRERSGWAMGVLSTGSVSGGLIGPLLGGYLAEVIGMRHVFLVTGAIMGVSFCMTWIGLVETFTPEDRPILSGVEVWQAIPDRRLLLAIFATSGMLQVATLSIEPILTVYVKQLLASQEHVALMSGLVVAASGLAAVIAAPRLGWLSDRVGPRQVLIGSMLAGGLLIVPQAFVQNAWQLTGLRFLFGLASAGMLPAMNSLVGSITPPAIAGRIYGYNQSAQYLGNIVGPIMGGLVAAQFGIQWVFYITSALLVLNAGWLALQRRIIASPEDHGHSVGSPALPGRPGQ